MLIAFALLCALLEAIFTAFEVAMGAVSRSRLRAVIETERLEREREEAERLDQEQDGRTAANGTVVQQRSPSKGSPGARAALILSLLERPRRLSLVFVIVTSITLWTAATTLVWQAHESQWNWWQTGLALLGVLFLAEVLPVLYAGRRPESVAMRGAYWIHDALKVFDPFVGPLASGARVAGAAGAATSGTNAVTPDELRSALATAEEEGVIESEERALLEGAMDFRERQVREVMTPMAEVVGIHPDAELKQALREAMRGGHSRLPVLDDSGRALGILAAKDLLPHLHAAPNSGTARQLMRTPLCVSGTDRVAEALDALRRERSLMAIVCEEDGHHIGIVTLEDLLEEIVGSIQDEYDEDEEEPLRILQQPDVERGVICNSDIKVREVERFWRETWHEPVRLQLPGGETPPGSLTLREFGQTLLGASDADCVPAGIAWMTPPLSTSRPAASSLEPANATESATVATAPVSAAVDSQPYVLELCLRQHGVSIDVTRQLILVQRERVASTEEEIEDE